ncbi:SusD/RagB family nutrient-binding outer membrane lipoprotein [Paraflavitalea speifideaquila]|uniref:SusD/RagB family nutrient-binding outer membrane lipoprotein n=1 Tax=Paraflavitalea speifideaquila TaxID=3076558 RepID=UPI0028ED5E46|nr:SusD/RagB family nutrient-binding outer membrane lipoprotein [Paraflavitalea speifideiaquila]
MKLNKHLSILTIAVAIAGIGCKKFIDVNKNPNSAQSAGAALIFTNGLNAYATSLAGGANLIGNYWGGFWAHSTSFTTGGPEKTYNFTNGNFNYWTGIFDNLTDLQHVIRVADKEGLSYLKGPAKIIKALRYQELVDIYGNVPFSEAFKGLAVFQPKYDKGEDIYDSLIVMLDEAIADLKKHDFPVTFPGNIYTINDAHDPADWVRFANTAKLRILMRLNNMPARQNFVRTEIQKILTEGSGFINPGGDVTSNPGYLKAAGKMNPFYFWAGYDENDATTTGYRLYRMSQYLVDTLKQNNDTIRLKYLAAVPDSRRPAGATDAYMGNVADYSGVPFGGETNNAYLSANSSNVGPARIIRGQASAPQVIFTAAECLFLQAEAAQRFGIAGLGNPQTLYEQGIRESFRLLGASDQAAANLIGKSANFVTAPDKVKAILYQKWVAMANFNGLEAWSEFRRNDYPAIPLSINRARLPERPVRLYYPQDEYSTNINNVNAQGEINVFTSRIFWDVK